MNSTRTGSAGRYARKKTPNGTGSSYQEAMGPGNTSGLYAFLTAEVQAGRMSASEKQRRVWLGK